MRPLVVTLLLLLGSGGSVLADETPPTAAVVDLGDIRGTAADPDAIDDLPNPPELRSSDGVLEATLTARPSRIRVAGKRFRSNVYNGLYIPRRSCSGAATRCGSRSTTRSGPRTSRSRRRCGPTSITTART
ncbi:hypothetical protein [Chenggangzhangella methanolivorans]|uniref:Uncharacterized protein n=1 Tax=Chenggangzhangella methanolivorans TaxID=1437009 RepID=A0A9E6UMC3_9HYPH|nr:hypothetical protein [Chenggangzhangella methanolivorans]QZO01532.1 hypothetical protein K6K41_08950 [Chenggangzhangella methanolivorans]